MNERSKKIWQDYHRPDGMEFLDLSEFKTKAGAAKALYEHLRKECAKQGLNPDIEVQLRSPSEAQKMGCGNNWQVVWESGPYQWAIGYSLSGMASNFDAGWYTEPYWGCDLCFTE